MKIHSLLSASLDPLAPDDTVETALGSLLEQALGHLPVVDGERLLVGLVSEEQLLEAPDADATVASLLQSRPVSVHPGEHVFDATRAMVRHDLSLLPVTEPVNDPASSRAPDASPADDDAAAPSAAARNEANAATPERYLGVVRRHDLFDQFARMLSTQEPGAILALEADERDYSLGQLVHLIEQSDVKVLSVSSESADGDHDGPRRITVKLNTTDTARVRHMLEHHGFDIVASFGEQDDQILERVQEFMRYLEV